MKTNYLNIDQNQYLSDIIESIPSDAIIHKVLTGLGATHLEITFNRNSIIIEPNVPVIQGKIKSHKGILGVYEGVSTFAIKKYLFNDKIKFKKILTTPESFEKVLIAMNALKIDVYKDYFLLYDECDRTVKDADFRKSILLPMNDFFKFQKKAFISATAMIPSDPRFNEQGFQTLYIKPSFDYSKDVKITTTNNPKASLKTQLKAISDLKDNQPVFVFFNSLNGIVSVIEDLKIADISAIFCSKESADKVKKGKVKAYAKFRAESIQSINFLTSRYFSALDIKLENGIRPHIIMLTDHNIAPHSMIDPASDAIQIPGRFRNGISSCCFIANSDESIFYREKDAAKHYLEGCENAYMEVKRLRDTSQNEGTKDSLSEALDHMLYSNFLDQDGNKNHYMYDNYYDQNRIKAYYISEASLIEAFMAKCKEYFNITHNIESYRMQSKYFNVKNIKKFNEILLELVGALDIIFDEDEDQIYTLFDKQSVYESIEMQYPYVVKAYRLLGREKLLAQGSCKQSIEQALLEYSQQSGFGKFDFLEELKLTIPVCGDIEQTEALTRFHNLSKKYMLDYKHTLKDFGYFFSYKTIKKNKGTRYLRVAERRFN